MGVFRSGRSQQPLYDTRKLWGVVMFLRVSRAAILSAHFELDR
jgi:hypothetical protein